MIKMGKLQVNQNIQPKAFLILTLFSLLLFFIFFGNAISNYLRTKDYIELNAIIKEVGIHNTHSSEGTSYTSYIEFDYEYNNETYTNEQRVAFRFNKKIGNSVKIYVNPNNPSEIRDTYNTRIGFIMGIFMLGITIFLVKAYNVRRKNNCS